VGELQAPGKGKKKNKNYSCKKKGMASADSYMQVKHGL
jgi:hypothetical protein